jgi:AraC family transcriptional regulator
LGISLKKYVLGRKLTLAFHKLSSSNESVINIALDCGYQYPEVFSRAFKKQFGISPQECRRGTIEARTQDKATIIPRDLISYSGGLILKAAYIYLERTLLEGVFIDIDVNDSEFESIIRETSEKFLTKIEKTNSIKYDKFYGVVNCLDYKSDKYHIFSGIESNENKNLKSLNYNEIQCGWYAKFTYQGEMLNICSTFLDDLFKWIALNEIRLDPNKIGIISIYDTNYFNTGEVQILIPVNISYSSRKCHENKNLLV